ARRPSPGYARRGPRCRPPNPHLGGLRSSSDARRRDSPEVVRVKRSCALGSASLLPPSEYRVGRAPVCDVRTLSTMTPTSPSGVYVAVDQLVLVAQVLDLGQEGVPRNVCGKEKAGLEPGVVLGQVEFVVGEFS